MADITKVSVYVNTANIAYAGADGWIYAGVAGREFALRAQGYNYAQGTTFTFVLGENTNVENADRNDPRKPQLDTDDLDRYPTYIRFGEEGTNNPEWCLERVTVTVNPGGDFPQRFDNPRLVGTEENQHIWLGHADGKIVYLKRY